MWCYFKEHYIFSGGGQPSFAAQASLSEAADAILGHVEDHHRGANHPGGGEKNPMIFIKRKFAKNFVKLKIPKLFSFRK